jgi:hypothetical protein
MTTRLQININSPHSQVELENRIDQGSKYNVINGIQHLLQGFEGGNEEGSLNVSIGAGDGVQAEEDVTIASSGAQSVTINGKALTGGTDYDIADLSVTEIAENIVSVVNASTDSRLSPVVASNVAGVVTIKSRVAGEIGNVYTLAATGAASAGAAVLSGGTESTQYEFDY